MRVQTVEQFDGADDTVILIRLAHAPTVDVAGDPLQADAVAFAPARRRPIRDRLRDRLIDVAVSRGADRATAEEVVDEVASERPLLDWLMNDGFEKLLDMILKLIGLLG